MIAGELIGTHKLEVAPEGVQRGPSVRKIGEIATLHENESTAIE